ncbi:methyltransferase domain-containing protein [Natronorubrum sp. JWXQ-INN-674]|uniref:Methyltransferase domain-containing protein n=1 Tax=Natronorubrum halalkaliphilum TaxID=2691917 RepID=A0A6B0VGK3_9EURY|nr:class I SAM-dependent methyltransferase [Natronorubrum halalkaliphilum]MXV60640.1 methyltransferase domain-containing protein [Natronorubrum halalkaliphilum]
MGRDESRSNSWNADDYDEDHSFVYEYGSDVLEVLDPEPGERILDLGCGTGHLTDRIASSDATVVGVDSAPEMIEQARETHPDRTFVHADARTMSFEGPFDAVFSNAALHWIPDEDQGAVLSSVREALSSGTGRFVAELGGTGNVERIVEATVAELEARGYEAESPWYFPSVGEYATRLEDHGFEVRFARLFDRPTELEGGDAGLRNWLGMFGDSLFESVPAAERTAVIDAVEDRLEPALYDRDEETWTADYRRLRFRAIRL